MEGVHSCALELVHDRFQRRQRGILLVSLDSSPRSVDRALKFQKNDHTEWEWERAVVNEPKDWMCVVKQL